MTEKSAAALLVHAEFVRALARGLLSDPNRVDDVVQETWTSALESPPRDASRPRAWLATVLRNRVRQEHRRAAARVTRERATARAEGAPSAATIVEREAVRRRVVDAVLSLDEPYRSTVLLRYYEDLPPREVAARLSVPVETVRTRLKRGLERLRRRLDAEHGEDRAAWATVLAPIALADPARAGLLVAAASALSSIPVWLAPGLAAALLVVLGVLGFAWFSEPDAPTATAPRTAGESVAAAPTPAVLAASPAAAPAVAPEREVSPVAAPRLGGVVVDAATGAPVPGAEVYVLGSPASEPAARPTSRTVTRSTRSDADGRFEVATLPSGVFAVVARTAERRSGPRALFVGDAWGPVAEEVRSSGSAPGPVLHASDQGVVSVRLEAFETGRVDGRVVTPEGRAVAGAEVVGLDLETTGPIDALLDTFGPLAVRTTSDEDGRFALTGLLGTAVVAARADGRFAERVELEIEAGTSTEPTLVLSPRGGPSVRGSVRDVDGLPLAGAVVRLGDGRVDDAARTAADAHPSTTTDDRGRFAFESLPGPDRSPWATAPGPDASYRITATAPGYVTEVSAPFAAGPSPASVDLVLASTSRVTGRVVDASTGRAVGGARVVLSRGVDLLETTESAEDGRFVLARLPDGEARLAVRAAGYRPVFSPPPTSRPLVVRLEPVAWTIRGEVVDGGGRPVPARLTLRFADRAESVESWRILGLPFDPRPLLEVGAAFDATVERLAGADAAWAAPAGEGGTFSLDAPARRPAPAVWLVLLAGERVKDVRRVTPTDGLVRFVLAAAEARDERAMVRVRAVEASGRPIRAARVTAFAVGRSDPSARSLRIGRDDPTVRIDVPGRYDLRVTADGHGAAVVPGVDVPAGGRLGPLVAALPAEARLEGEVLFRGERVTDATVLVFDANGRRVEIVSPSDGTFEIGGLAPGRHLVRAVHATRGFGEREVDVRAGEIRPVPLPLAVDHEVRLDLSAWPGDPNARAAVDLLDARGRPTSSGRRFTSVGRAVDVRWFAAPGTWNVRVVAIGAAPVVHSFEIEAAGSTVVRVPPGG